MGRKLRSGASDDVEAKKQHRILVRKKGKKEINSKTVRDENQTYQWLGIDDFRIGGLRRGGGR